MALPVRSTWLLGVGAAALAACYSPHIGDGTQACGPGGACAPGFACGPDRRCWRNGSAPPSPADLSAVADIAAPPDLATCTQASCGGATPICDPDSGQCVPCLIDSQCPLSQLCQAKQCVDGCTGSHGCADGGGFCDVDAGTCRACHSDVDCADPANPRCDTNSGLCAPCQPAADNCPEGQYCAPKGGGWQCAQGCKVDNDCNPAEGGDGGAGSDGGSSDGGSPGGGSPDGGSSDGGSPRRPLACCNHACIDLAADAANCGACGTACANNGACCAGTCADTTKDVANCGQCGNACAGKNADWQCTNGACAVTTCHGTFQDCDGDPKDGCESDITSDPNNCTACGKACTFPNAAPACMNGCVVGKCNSGFTHCTANPADGCETNVDGDLANCGACNNVCASIPNGSVACVMGLCAVGSCMPGWGDCDMRADNGCEANLGTDFAHCRSCNNACPPVKNGTPGCNNGICGVAGCANGFKDCNGDPSDGCETNVGGDVANCGTCRLVCAAPPNAAAACTGGSCGLGLCNAGYLDCNLKASDGCEVNGNADSMNCKTCGNVCPPVANGTPGCTNGACGIGACNPGYTACAGACVNLTSDVKNCGACGKVCPNGQTCQGGACVVLATCMRIGWFTGSNMHPCPNGWRWPTVNEYNLVAPCILPGDQGMFTSYNDIAIDVGGCNCKWNGGWCGQPSMDTIRQGRTCGDYQQLQICVQP